MATSEPAGRGSAGSANPKNDSGSEASRKPKNVAALTLIGPGVICVTASRLPKVSGSSRSSGAFGPTNSSM